MNQREAMEYGRKVGFDIGETNISEKNYLQIEHMDPFDEYVQDCADSHENYKQFSPWEFFAHEVNETGDRAEGIWDMYENAFYMGVRKAWREKRHLMTTGETMEALS